MHDPVTHAELTQAVLLPHVPLDEQVSTLLFTHRVAAGAHTPVHVPPTHAWFEQGAPFCQVPVLSHV
jgi:hypothetical protein